MSRRQRNQNLVGGLDDLFARADEPVADQEPVETAPKRRSRTLWVVRNLLLIAVATVVTVAILRSVGIGVSVPLVVAAFLALRLLMLAVAEVAPPPVPKAVPRRTAAGDEGADHWGGTDSLRVAVRRWEQRLAWSQSDPEAFTRTVAPVLGELIDERLRLHHGITRESDPRRARELVGEPVWGMLAAPGRRSTRPGDITAYLETLERLGERVHR